METEERVEKEFVAGEKPQLAVANVRGSITVHGGDGGAVQVTAVKRLESCRHPERTEIEITQEGDRVVARTRHRDEWSGLILQQGGGVCAVDYTVQVPTHCEVQIRQVAGTVQVSGISGEVQVNAVEGEVNLREIAGRTEVKAVSATVAGEGWSGRASVDTVSGAVQIAGAQLSHLQANVVSGDLSLETAVDASGRYDFNSVSGDVTLYLPAERGIESRGSTISGQLVCDLPHAFSHRGRGGWRATINGGGPPVRFNSISGDLEVLAAKPV